MPANTSITIHGNLNSEVIKNDPKAKKEKVYGLNFPIGRRVTGGFFSKISGLDLVKANLRQLLQTERGERVYLPNYGCNLKKYLFQPMDEITFEQIKTEILTSISRYSKGVRVLSLKVTPRDDNSLRILLRVQIREIENTITEVEVDI